MKEQVYLIVKKILNIKSNYLDHIDDIEYIKADLLSFCRNLLKNENLDTSFINLHLEHNINVNTYFNFKIQDNVTFYIKTINSLLEVNERLVYYYSQETNTQNDLYQNYNELGEIIYNLNNKLLPRYFFEKIHKIQEKQYSLESELFREIHNDPNTEFFWRSLNEMSQYRNRETLINDLNNKNDFIEIDNFLNYKISINDKISENLKSYNKIILSKIKSNFNFNEDFECINLSYRNLFKLLNFEFLDDKLINYEISNNISNNDIIHILRIFPEFTLSFSLMESRPFYINKHQQTYKINNKTYKEHKFFGKLKIKYPILEVHHKAKFTKKEEELLFKLLDKISLDNKFYNIDKKAFIL